MADHTAKQVRVPAGYRTINDLVARSEANPKRRAALERARRWMAEEFYADEGTTVRTLRLKKGLSQAKVAEALSTSQSHVARIERGTEDVRIDTCRRLCAVLGVDLNTLDQALRNQIAAKERENQ